MGSATAADLRRFLEATGGLSFISIARVDGTVATSLVNSGIHDHPLSGAPCAAFVVRSDARKLVHIRAGRKVTVAVHNRWEWVAATGSAQIFGPDDPLPGDPVDGFDTAPVPALLRSVFQSAGGTHDDWDAYDRVMCEEHRAAVFVLLDRLYGTMRG